MPRIEKRPLRKPSAYTARSPFHEYDRVIRCVAQTLSLPRRHSCRRCAETSLGVAGRSARATERPRFANVLKFIVERSNAQ
jgi:hypothetical protein